MLVKDFYTQEVVTVAPETTVAEAAKVMRSEHVGDVVVVDASRGKRPIGILTDRDIVISIVATGLDTDVIAVEDIMSYELTSVEADQDLAEVIDRMVEASVRRLPVTDEQGRLIGLLSLDDVIHALGAYMDKISRLPDVQRFRERTARM